MKAAVFDHYGPPDVLRVEEVPPPEPDADEVLVRVHSVALTRADCATRDANRNSGPLTSTISRLVSGVRAPRRRILGSEFAGVVEKTGAEVHRFQAGDRVFGSTGFGFGGHAEYLVIRESGRIARMPERMTFDEGAATCDGGLNSLWCLRRGGVKAGDDVLVYGASGAIGSAGVQIARHLGARVTGVTTAGNAALVESLGAHELIDYQKEDFTRNGRRYDIVFDAVGKLAFTACKTSLKADGRYLATDGLGNFVRSRYSKQVVFDIPPRYTQQDVVYLKKLIETDEFKPVIDRCHPLEQIREAATYVETEQKVGNVILHVIA